MKRMDSWRRGVLRTTLALATFGAVSAGGWGNDLALDDLSIEELLGETVSVEEIEERINSALASVRATGDATVLLPPLDTLIRNDDLLPSHETFEALTDALIRHGDAEALALRTPRLLHYSETAFHPPAIAKFNLGIRLALTFGGATFEDLRPLVGRREADLVWLLPALGKTGADRAKPLLAPHRNDPRLESIQHHNFEASAIPYAALLGSAYAGCADAMERLLEVQDRHLAIARRLTGYIMYSLVMHQRAEAERTGAVHARCRRRIEQADRLLDDRGRAVLPMLIERAVTHGSRAAIRYLPDRLDRAPAEWLADFIGLLDHPEPFLKARVFRRLWDAGDASMRADLRKRLLEMTSASAGHDRLFAVTMLLRHVPLEGDRALARALDRETSPAVRIQLEDLAR